MKMIITLKYYRAYIVIKKVSVYIFKSKIKISPLFIPSLLSLARPFSDCHFCLVALTHYQPCYIRRNTTPCTPSCLQVGWWNTCLTSWLDLSLSVVTSFWFPLFRAAKKLFLFLFQFSRSKIPAGSQNSSYTIYKTIKNWQVRVSKYSYVACLQTFRHIVPTAL